MATFRFILAMGELITSPAMLLFYAAAGRFARNRQSTHQLLDFSPHLG